MIAEKKSKKVQSNMKKFQTHKFELLIDIHYLSIFCENSIAT